MSENKTQDGFIMQAGILAAAGILVRIIGILYRSPLTSIIGDEGNGYYSTAYNIYTIILLLSSYSIPAAISKVIAQKLALKEYRNAHRIFRCAVIYVVVVGGLASALTYVFAGVLVDVNSVGVLRIFVPTIFFSGLLGVLRGYFQAHRTMVQTSLSQILEQILNAVVSLLAAWLLIRSAAGSDDTTRAIRGAMGSAMGTGAGVLVALIFMFCLYRLNSRQMSRKIQTDTTDKDMPYREIFITIFCVVTPFILSTFIYNFSTSLDQTIYIKIMLKLKNYTSAEAATMYGIFAGKTVVILNIPIAIASAISTAMIPTISGTFATGDMDATREKVTIAIRTTMLIAIPSAVGMGVLAKPIMMLLFPQKESLDLASSLLQAISIAVVFYSLSTLTNAVLQGIGRVNRPVINAALALVLQTLVLVPMLIFTNFNQYCMVAATIVYSLSMCVLNHRSVVRFMEYKQEYLKTFLMPALSAIIMGVVAWGVYQICYQILHTNVISLFVSIMAAILVYFMMVIKTGAMGEEEMRQIPKGRSLIVLARRLHLM